MADLFVGLHPALVDKVRRVLTAMSLAGHTMRVCQGVRDTAYQQALYRQGRTAPGKRVTKADGVKTRSNHQVALAGPYQGWGTAVDCCFTTGKPFGEGQPWHTYGLMAEREGLSWGGRWRTPDRPHIELPLPIAGEVQA